MNGHKRRSALTAELLGEAITAAVALALQLLSAEATATVQTSAAAIGSRPTLIIK